MEDGLLRWIGRSSRVLTILLIAGIALCLGIFALIVAFSQATMDPTRKFNFLGKQAIIWGVFIAAMIVYLYKGSRRTIALRRLVASTQPMRCDVTIRCWIPSGTVPVIWADLRLPGDSPSGSPRWSLQLGDVPTPLAECERMYIENDEIGREQTYSGLVYADGSKRGYVLILVEDRAVTSKDEVLLEGFELAAV